VLAHDHGRNSPKKKGRPVETERPSSPQKPRALNDVPKATLREVMSFHAIPAAGLQSKPNINLNIRLARKSHCGLKGAFFSAACAKSVQDRFKRKHRMRSKTIIDLYAYWDELRGRRDVPDRGQIEPAHIRTLLAELFILERTPRAGIRFRLAGTRICALFQRELRGSAFDALWRGEQIGRIASLAADVMAQKMPVVLCASALAANGDQVGTEIILLPMK
jgi:hypothetical protein